MNQNIEHILDLHKSGLATADDMLELITQAEAAVQFAREAKRLAEDACIAWINVHGQDLSYGDVRYYVGTESKSQAKSHEDVITAIAMLAEGDLAGVAECLSSDAWKVGSTRAKLGDEQFATLFETTKKLDLKTGKPVRGLQKVNKAFQKGK